MILLDSKVLSNVDEKLPMPAAGDQRADWSRRLRLLWPEDRVLVQMAQEQRLSRREMGALLGMSKGNVSRRIRRLQNRLGDPLVGALADRDCSLADDYLRIGLEHFLLDRPVAELARRRRITPDRARAMIAYVRGWHRGISRK
jgi:hypothetical protein